MALISTEFFKDDSPTVTGWEDTLLFLIDHYAEIMSRFRVIQEFHNFTSDKQKKAHEELQKLRADLQGKILSNEADKLSVQEKQEYLSKIREEPEVVYYHGKPMDKDLISKMILKHQKYLKSLEKADRYGRQKVSKILSFGTSVALFPLRFMLGKTIDQTEKGKVLDILNLILETIEDIPDSIEDKIMMPMTVNIDDHKPQDVEE